MTYIWHIPYIYMTYTIHIHDIYMTCTIHIHSILCVFLHPVAGVAKIAGKCRAWQARHTNRSSSTSVISLPEKVPKTRANNVTVKGIVGWKREWTVIPGIYQVYACIYLVYTSTKKLKRGQVAGSNSKPGPLAFYRGPALCLRLSLTSISIPAIFLQRCTHYNIFNPLDLFNQSRVEDDKGQARKEKETTKKKKG